MMALLYTISRSRTTSPSSPASNGSPFASTEKSSQLLHQHHNPNIPATSYRSITFSTVAVRLQDNHRHRDTPHCSTNDARKARSTIIRSLIPAIFAFRIAAPFRLANRHAGGHAVAQRQNDPRSSARLFSRVRGFLLCPLLTS
jgi:hypothetical protein